MELHVVSFVVIPVHPSNRNKWALYCITSSLFQLHYYYVPVIVNDFQLQYTEGSSFTRATKRAIYTIDQDGRQRTFVLMYNFFVVEIWYRLFRSQSF